jgi:hypothetical protein
MGAVRPMRHLGWGHAVVDKAAHTEALKVKAIPGRNPALTHTMISSLTTADD